MSDIQEKPQAPWYFKKSAVIVAFLCVGPLALPLLWLNPQTKLVNKIWISVVVLVLTYLLYLWTKQSIEVINEYYKQML
jgi:hypothetical protein